MMTILTYFLQLSWGRVELSVSSANPLMCSLFCHLVLHQLITSYTASLLLICLNLITPILVNLFVLNFFWRRSCLYYKQLGFGVSRKIICFRCNLFVFCLPWILHFGASSLQNTYHSLLNALWFTPFPMTGSSAFSFALFLFLMNFVT